MPHRRKDRVPGRPNPSRSSVRGTRWPWTVHRSKVGKPPSRHCERSEAIHRAAKRRMDCLPPSLAELRWTSRRLRVSQWRQTWSRILAARCVRAVCDSCPQKSEGAEKTGCALHPRSRVQDAQSKRTRAYRFSGEHPAFPARWLYGL